MGARSSVVVIVALLIATSLVCTLTGAALALQRPDLESLETDTASSLHADYSRDERKSPRPPLSPDIIAAAAADNERDAIDGAATDAASPPPRAGAIQTPTPRTGGGDGTPQNSPTTSQRSPTPRPAPADAPEPTPTKRSVPPTSTPVPAKTFAPAPTNTRIVVAPSVTPRPSNTPVPSNTPIPAATKTPTKAPQPVATTRPPTATDTPCPVLIILPICL